MNRKSCDHDGVADVKNKPADSGRLIQLLDRGRLCSSVKQGDRLLVAVSGGADSVALLRGLATIALELKFEIGAVHVNHGLRAEAQDEEKFVSDLCAQLSIPCHMRRLNPEEAGPAGGSAEAHWRALRYAAFADIMQDQNYEAVTLGHTADDLAETFLFHLARGTGVDGLTFQFESDQHSLRIIRPLWKTSRADIESALRGAGQHWMEDPSNQNTRHRRNLIRHKIMPLLREINTDATAAIVRASEAISEAVETRSSCHSPAAAAPDESSPLQSDVPAGTLALRRFLCDEASQALVAPALREFIQQNNAKINSRQLDQARRMIIAENTGLVSLADNKTFVITRQFTWIISRREPSTMTLAAEHSRRFGGLVANIGYGVRLDPDACITDLDGTEYHIKCAGAAPHSILANRISGASAGNTSLKKILNQHQVPWYLREWQVYVVGPDGKSVLALLDFQDSDLARTILRHSRAELQLDMTPVSNRA